MPVYEVEAVIRRGGEDLPVVTVTLEYDAEDDIAACYAAAVRFSAVIAREGDRRERARGQA